MARLRTSISCARTDDAPKTANSKRTPRRRGEKLLVADVVMSRSSEEPADAAVEGEVVDHFRRRLEQRAGRGRRFEPRGLPRRPKRAATPPRRYRRRAPRHF